MGRSFGSGIDVSNDTAISLLMHVHGIWWQNTVSFGRASRYGVLDQNTMGTHAARCRGCLKCTSRMWVHQNCRSVHLCTFQAAISRTYSYKTGSQGTRTVSARRRCTHCLRNTPDLSQNTEMDNTFEFHGTHKGLNYY